MAVLLSVAAFDTIKNRRLLARSHRTNYDPLRACGLACSVVQLDTFCRACLFISLVLHTWQMSLGSADRPLPQK